MYTLYNTFSIRIIEICHLFYTGAVFGKKKKSETWQRWGIMVVMGENIGRALKEIFMMRLSLYNHQIREN